MKISRKADYALSAVAHMAAHPMDRRHTINQIAEAGNLPRDFLAKILKELTRAQIIRAFQGVQGGYQLAKTPNKINVLEVIEAMDGPVALNLCVRGMHGPNCGPSKSCTIYPFFAKAQTQFVGLMKGQTFDKFRRGK